tara:strand:- start:1002 stop:1748 length:747 start_codon:yes stop_codon:yes gene_type:complete
MPFTTTIVDLLKDLVGDDFKTAVPQADPHFIEAGIRDVMDICPDELLWKNIGSPDETTTIGYGRINGSPGQMKITLEDRTNEDGKIVRVTRRDADNVDRDCREIKFDEVEDAKDENSLKYATKHNPVYYIDHSYGLTTVYALPETPETAAGPNANPMQVYLAKYPYHSVDSYETESGTWVDVMSTHNLPKNAIQCLLYKIGLYILDAKLSIAIQDDEDSEIVQLLNAQKAAFQDIWKIEIQKLTKVSD